jgi:hypothetical protein
MKTRCDTCKHCVDKIKIMGGNHAIACDRITDRSHVGWLSYDEKCKGYEPKSDIQGALECLAQKLTPKPLTLKR